MNFLAAVAFLTTLPVRSQARWEDNGKVLYFPVVGLIIGVFLCAVDYVGSFVFAPGLRSLVDLFFLAAITRGLHLDGLADTADGLFSHRSREESLKIMRDSRIGVMGVLALLFCILFKWESISLLPGENRWLFLLAAPALARASLVIGVVLLPYARRGEGLAKRMTESGKGALSFVCLPMLLPFLVNWRAACAMNLVFISCVAFLLWSFKKKLNGVTGDTLGAMCEIVECAILMTGSLLSQRLFA